MRQKKLKPLFIKPKPLEKDIEKKICDYAKAKGCKVHKFTSPSQRSVPDRLFVAPNGVTGFFEVKREGEVPTDKQACEIRLFAAQGAPCTWGDSVEAGKAFIDQLCSLPSVALAWAAVSGTGKEKLPDERPCADVLA